MAAFYAYQVSVAVTAIATEDFDPDGARHDIGNEDSDNPTKPFASYLP